MLPVRRRELRRSMTDPFETMRRDLARMFGYAPEMELPTGETALTAEYPMDVREEDGKILVDAEMPGFNKDEIDVSLDNGVLSISAERREEPTKGTSHLRERRYARVQRSVALPADVDEDKIEARLDNGVLHLEMPETSEQQGRKITVK